MEQNEETEESKFKKYCEKIKNEVYEITNINTNLDDRCVAIIGHTCTSLIKFYASVVKQKLTSLQKYNLLDEIVYYMKLNMIFLENNYKDTVYYRLRSFLKGMLVLQSHKTILLKLSEKTRTLVKSNTPDQHLRLMYHDLYTSETESAFQLDVEIKQSDIFMHRCDEYAVRILSEIYDRAKNRLGNHYHQEDLFLREIKRMARLHIVRLADKILYFDNAKDINKLDPDILKNNDSFNQSSDNLIVEAIQLIKKLPYDKTEYMNGEIPDNHDISLSELILTSLIIANDQNDNTIRNENNTSNMNYSIIKNISKMINPYKYKNKDVQVLVNDIKYMYMGKKYYEWILEIDILLNKDNVISKADRSYIINKINRFNNDIGFFYYSYSNFEYNPNNFEKYKLLKEDGTPEMVESNGNLVEVTVKRLIRHPKPKADIFNNQIFLLFKSFTKAFEKIVMKYNKIEGAEKIKFVTDADAVIDLTSTHLDPDDSDDEEFDPNDDEEDPTGVADRSIRPEYYQSDPTPVVFFNSNLNETPFNYNPGDFSEFEVVQNEAQHELETQSTDDEDDDSEMPVDEYEGSDEE